MTDDEVAKACADLMWSEDRASQGLGMVVDLIAPGEAVLSMVVTDVMLNGVGTCHGGFVFSLADSAFAFACNTYNQHAVAQMANITFVAPAHLDDRLTAHAREIHRRGRGGIYDVMVRRASGEMIAAFRGHSRTIKGKPLSDGPRFRDDGRGQ